MVFRSDKILATYAGHIATGLLICVSIASSCRLTAWMHNLLSFSHQHPVPKGVACDVGVVLGYALHRNGSCTWPLKSRVQIGVQAYEQHEVVHLIFSGAHPGGGVRNVSEANAMESYALSLVPQTPPAGRWLLEERSTSTRTNAIYSLSIVRQLLDQQSLQRQDHSPKNISVVLFTNPFHQLRSYFTFRRVAKQAGMDVQLYVAEAPFAGHHGYGNLLLDCAMDQFDFWRELAAIAWYWIRSYM